MFEMPDYIVIKAHLSLALKTTLLSHLSTRRNNTKSSLHCPQLTVRRLIRQISYAVSPSAGQHKSVDLTVT